MIISYVPIDSIMDGYLPIVGPLLQKAIDKSEGQELLEDYIIGLVDDRYHLFIGYDEEDIHVAALTQFVKYPEYTNLSIVLVGGSRLEEWISSEVLFEFGRYHDCKAVELTGRRGWLKALEPKGYRESCVTLIKDL